MGRSGGRMSVMEPARMLSEDLNTSSWSAVAELRRARWRRRLSCVFRRRIMWPICLAPVAARISPSDLLLQAARAEA